MIFHVINPLLENSSLFHKLCVISVNNNCIVHLVHECDYIALETL